MAPKPPPGRSPKLLGRQKATLVKLLLAGPQAAGFPTDLRTTRRIAEVIDWCFGIHYHPNHVWRVLVGLGWSYQKPQTKARERDEAAIVHWKRYWWSHIKNAQRRGAPLVFLDESGFLLIPSIRRTWAPRAQTPILRTAGRWTKLWAISALSLSPKRHRIALYLRFYGANITATEVQGFLTHLLCHLKAPLFSCGTVPRSTRRSRFNDSSLPISGCTPSDFLAMPRNSTRMNSSGTNSNAVFAMPCPKTWAIFGNFSNAPYSDCADLKDSYGRASKRPTFHGHDFLLFMRKSVTCDWFLFDLFRLARRTRSFFAHSFHRIHDTTDRSRLQPRGRTVLTHEVGFVVK